MKTKIAVFAIYLAPFTRKRTKPLSPTRGSR